MDIRMQIGGNLLYVIDTFGQIVITILLLMVLTYLITGYIEQGKILKKLREENAERERERIKKEKENPLRKV
jgi:hypothetical protein